MRFEENYPLKVFQCVESSTIQKIITCYPLATLISGCRKLPEVTQVPLIFSSANDDFNILEGHLDINNPFASEVRNGEEVYCLFNGPNSYISPSIYPDEQFPGWNFVSVHITGVLKPVEEQSALTDILIRTAENNEESDSGYKLSPDQRNFTQLLDYILGFQVEIHDAKAVIKLAQDKSASNTLLAKARLEEMATRDISAFLDDLLEKE